jgi:alkane 1-monooxygenase
MMYIFLTHVGDHSLPLWEKGGLILAFGISCGVFGINVAHELGHRNTWYEQLMSKALLLSTLYMHFFIEHNRGHHKNVSTDEDSGLGSRRRDTVWILAAVGDYKLDRCMEAGERSSGQNKYTVVLSEK